jgi:sialate O-acetylesterase
MGRYTGMVEFRMKFKVPHELAGKALVLELGPIDEIDICWVNGVNVGSQPHPYSWNTPRVYEIPAGVVKKGKNTLAIQIGNTSGAGGIFGSPEQLRFYPKENPQSFRLLKGKWFARKSKSYGEVVPMPWCDNCGEPNTPTTLYNGMINPLIPFRIKGAIWYQGESNRYDGELYGKIFPNMINNWRDSWNQGDFPFYYVQIAPYTYRDALSTGLLREAQSNTMLLPSTGMVVTMDIGDLITIHPPDKENVGKRLAYWALANDYGKDLAFSGPLYKEYRIEGDKIRINFDHAEEGLRADGNDLKHFQIAGRDKVFVPAIAKISGSSVIVSSPDVNKPVAVRFGWGSTDQTNLFNLSGLPAGPFRTDRWED